jgi:hypothetical protein
LFFSPQSTIERFFLPDFSPAIQKLVDAVRRRAFDGLHDVSDGNGAQRTTDRYHRKVYVIWHDDQAIQVKFQTITSQTGIDDNCSRCWRQIPTPIGAESGEEDLKIWLKMG